MILPRIELQCKILCLWYLVNEAISNSAIDEYEKDGIKIGLLFPAIMQTSVYIFGPEFVNFFH